jgi:hypothetical protein
MFLKNPKNQSLAAHYLKLATEHGHADAQWLHAVLLSHNHNGEKKRHLAPQYSARSADQGSALHQFAYAGFLFQGDGIEMNNPLVLHYCKDLIKTIERYNLPMAGCFSKVITLIRKY